MQQYRIRALPQFPSSSDAPAIKIDNLAFKGSKKKKKITGSSIYSIEFYSSPFVVLKLQAKRPPWYLTFEEWKLFEWTTFQTPHTISSIFNSSPQKFTDCCPAKELGSQPLSAFSLLQKKYYLQQLTGKLIVEAKLPSVIALERTCEVLRNAKAKSKNQPFCQEHRSAFWSAYMYNSINYNTTGKQVSWKLLPRTALKALQTEIRYLKRRNFDGK